MISSNWDQVNMLIENLTKCLDRKRLGVLALVHGLCTFSIVFLFGFLCLFGCVDPPELTKSFNPVSEFEEQESTYLSWHPLFEDVLLRLTTVLARQDHVTIFYNETFHDPDNIKDKIKKRHINSNNVALLPFKMEDDNIWIRDYAPIFMQDEHLNTMVFSFLYPHVAQAEYNFFAEQFASQNQLPFMRSKIYSSGGGREINGKGTIILIEGYEKTINPNMSKEEIEHEYREKFNQTNFIWLKRGLPMDDHFDNGPVFENIYGNGVNWHIDEFCRFANAETILLAQVDSADLVHGGLYQILWERLEESYEILKSSLDQDGKPFNIVRVPQAPVILKEADYHGTDIFFTPITSYLNFVLSNNTVVIPAYFRIGDPESIKAKDNKAKEVFESVFPNKKVAMINSLDLNYLGGGLHCITATKPKTKKKKFTLSIFNKRSYG